MTQAAWSGQRARVSWGLARAAWIFCAIVVAPGSAGADWLVTPFVGSAFGGSTNIIVLSPSVGDKKFTFGGSVSFLSDGLLGLEAEVAHTPHFFENSRGGLVLQSRVSTVTGSLIAAMPIAITGYSLRPYLVGGVGLLHASSHGLIDINSFDSDLLALTVGGGAIGFITNKTGVRFELRNIRNLSPDDSTVTTSGRSTRLSFWRASLGIVLRY